MTTTPTPLLTSAQVAMRCAPGQSIPWDDAMRLAAVEGIDFAGAKRAEEIRPSLFPAETEKLAKTREKLEAQIAAVDQAHEKQLMEAREWNRRLDAIERARDQGARALDEVNLMRSALAEKEAALLATIGENFRPWRIDELVNYVGTLRAGIPVAEEFAAKKGEAVTTLIAEAVAYGKANGIPADKLP